MIWYWPFSILRSGLLIVKWIVSFKRHPWSLFPEALNTIDFPSRVVNWLPLETVVLRLFFQVTLCHSASMVKIFCEPSQFQRLRTTFTVSELEERMLNNLMVAQGSPKGLNEKIVSASDFL